jgi:hypothetical protein
MEAKKRRQREREQDEEDELRREEEAEEAWEREMNRRVQERKRFDVEAKQKLRDDLARRADPVWQAKQQELGKCYLLVGCKRGDSKETIEKIYKQKLQSLLKSESGLKTDSARTSAASRKRDLGEAYQTIMLLFGEDTKAEYKKHEIAKAAEVERQGRLKKLQNMKDKEDEEIQRVRVLQQQNEKLAEDKRIMFEERKSLAWEKLAEDRRLTEERIVEEKNKQTALAAKKAADIAANMERNKAAAKGEKAAVVATALAKEEGKREFEANKKRGEAKKEAAALAEKQRLTIQKQQVLAPPPLRSSNSSPVEFLCPISREVMIDPVIAADGYTYEKVNIEACMEASKNR